MKASIMIRKTGTTVVEVLNEIAQGFTHQQIIEHHKELTLGDIMGAAQFAADLISEHVTTESELEIEGEIVLRAHNRRIYNLTQIRKEYPRAFEKWSQPEENELVQMFKTGIRIDEIATRLQRKKGAITSRLERLELLPRRSETTP